MQPLRVLIWYPFGLGPDYHGPSIATYRLLSALRGRHSVHVTLVHGKPAQEEDPAIADRYVRLPGPTMERPAMSPLGYWRYLRAAQRWLRAHGREFDVFHAPAANKFTLGPALIAQGLGIPAVGRIAAAAAELEDASTLKRLLGVGRQRRAMIARLDRIVALSTAIRDALIGYGVRADKVRLIPNGVDIARFRPATPGERSDLRARYSIPADACVACCVGAITDRKGQLLLVDAVARLPADMHLLLAGPCRDQGIEARLEAAIAQAGIAGRVHRLGHVHDVENVYRASDLFCLVSTDEGMPNAMVEAMASGLPAIGTPISGIEDLIADQRGRFAARHAATIAAALDAYRSDPQLMRREGEASRQFVGAELSADAVADRTMELWAETARLRAPRRARCGRREEIAE